MAVSASSLALERALQARNYTHGNSLINGGAGIAVRLTDRYPIQLMDVLQLGIESWLITRLRHNLRKGLSSFATSCLVEAATQMSPRNAGKAEKDRVCQRIQALLAQLPLVHGTDHAIGKHLIILWLEQLSLADHCDVLEDPLQSKLRDLLQSTWNVRDGAGTTIFQRWTKVTQVRSPGLDLASWRRQTERMWLTCLTIGGDGNQEYNPAESHLYMACFLGMSLAVVEALLRAGAKVTTSANDGMTPLLASCKKHSHDVITTLLAAGADPKSQNNNGDTALILACSHPGLDVAIVQLLLTAGASPVASNTSGKTPLMMACLHVQSIAVVNALLDAGADIKSAAKDVEPLLMVACRQSKASVAVVQALLDAGADARASFRNGLTPLMAACLKADVAVVQALLTAGADPAAVTLIKENTALTFACRSKADVAVVQALLDAGADRVENQAGDTPLTLVCSELGDVAVLQALISAGADVLKPNGQYQTPLGLACNHQALPLIEALLQAGAGPVVPQIQQLISSSAFSSAPVAVLQLLCSELQRHQPCTLADCRDLIVMADDHVRQLGRLYTDDDDDWNLDRSILQKLEVLGVDVPLGLRCDLGIRWLLVTNRLNRPLGEFEMASAHARRQVWVLASALGASHEIFKLVSKSEYGTQALDWLNTSYASPPVQVAIPDISLRKPALKEKLDAALHLFGGTGCFRTHGNGSIVLPPQLESLYVDGYPNSYNFDLRVSSVGSVHLRRFTVAQSVPVKLMLEGALTVDRFEGSLQTMASFQGLANVTLHTWVMPLTDTADTDLLEIATLLEAFKVKFFRTKSTYGSHQLPESALATIKSKHLKGVLYDDVHYSTQSLLTQSLRCQDYWLLVGLMRPIRAEGDPQEPDGNDLGFFSLAVCLHELDFHLGETFWSSLLLQSIDYLRKSDDDSSDYSDYDVDDVDDVDGEYRFDVLDDEWRDQDWSGDRSGRSSPHRDWDYMPQAERDAWDHLYSS